jgi:hypothetical protein
MTRRQSAGTRAARHMLAQPAGSMLQVSSLGYPVT